MAINDAFLATPENEAPVPAATPARWVPCEQPATPDGHATPDPVAVLLIPPGQTELANEPGSVVE